MKNQHNITLALLGGILGGLLGALFASGSTQGDNALLWALGGALALAALAVASRGGVLSLLFLRYDRGSSYTGHAEGEGKRFWLIIGFFGFACGSIRFHWLDHVSDAMLYLVVPGLGLACLALGYLLHQKLNLISCIIFGCAGLVWAICELVLV